MRNFRPHFRCNCCRIVAGNVSSQAVQRGVCRAVPWLRPTDVQVRNGFLAVSVSDVKLLLYELSSGTFVSTRV